MSGTLRRPEQGLILVGLLLGGVYVAVCLFESRLYFAIEGSAYAVIHTLMELASIFVSFSVFIVNWEASKQSENTKGLFLATGFLTVATLETMHTLSYPGMPDFITPNDVSKSIYYYLFGRLWAAGLLWAAAYVRPESSGRYFSRPSLLAANLMACVVPFTAVTLFPDRLPAMFVDGQGLTTFKVAAEYLVIALSLAGVLAHLRVYRSTRDESVVLLMTALVVSVFAQLAFTRYVTGTDLYHVLGHIYKAVSYYMIFRALLVFAVQRPYVQLRVAKERLEQTVAQLDARNRELDALDEVTLTLSSTLRPDEMLGSAVEKVMAVMNAGAGAIFLQEEGTGRLRLASWRGLSKDVVESCVDGWLPPVGGGGPRAGGGRATALEDPALVRSLGGSTARIAPLRVCVCAPIVSKGRSLGALAMVAAEGRAYSPGDADLLTAIGFQLGLSIENAQLYERTDERLRQNLKELQTAERRSRFLSEVGALLGSSTDLGQALEQVARMTTEVVGDWCSIYLMDDREKLLRLGAVYHPDEQELEAVRRVLNRRPIRLDEGFVGRVARSGQATLVSPVSGEEIAEEVRHLAHSVEEIALLRRVVPTSRIAAPMRARGHIVGVLLVMAVHSRQQLGEGDLALVTELADRVGVAVDNSRLFQENLSQRQHLEAVISQMVDGVVIADRAGNILVANVAARRMLGETVGRLVAEGGAVPPRRPERSHGAHGSVPPLVTRALAGELVMGEEISVGVGAMRRIMSAIASPILDESEQIAGAVVVLRDVTAEREIERMKEEFMATVSHELRTPITAVIGYTDILLRGLRGPLLPKQGEALRAVKLAAQRLLVLINDLLDMSRLEAGKTDLSVEPVDLYQATERSLTAISVLASAKGIRLIQKVPRDLPPVLADPEQLQRVLGNLLSNAIKFTGEGGMVSVSARVADGPIGRFSNDSGAQPSGSDHVAVFVSDTGIGIPPDVQQRIWDKFQQGDSSSRRMFGGTGLGLAITKGIVELHGGRVWVESEGIPGKGSTFGFTLPVVSGLPPG